MPPAGEKAFFAIANEINDKLIYWRRHFHQSPELGFQEYNTQEFVVKTLTDMGIVARTGIGWHTSVVAEIGEGKPIIAIRADMDGLPITENSNKPYRSQVDGVMHACGHDAYLAMVLGAAYLLSKAKGHQGRVHLIFQPAEETSDSTGKTGSGYLLDSGVLDGVSAIIALHVDPDLPVGKVALSRDLISAAVDPFTAELRGSSTHVASPEKGMNAIWLLSQVLPMINSIPSILPPNQPCIITVTTVHGGNKDNVIPDKVSIAGTIRSQDEFIREQLHQRLKQCLETVKQWGGHTNFK